MYARERFPVPAALLYTGAQYALVYTFAGTLPGAAPASGRAILLGWLSAFLMLLRLRISDDRKDFARDVQAYPDRLLSRGVITHRELAALGWAALAVELALIALLGRDPLLVWLGVNAWFALMVVEFFAPRFLDARIGWYLVSHQLLVPLIGLLPLAVRAPGAALAAAPATAALLGALLGGTMTYEIARKTWSPDREHPSAVSYSRDWGIGPSVAVNQALALASTILLVWLQRRAGCAAAWSAPVVVAFLAFLVAGLAFLRRPDRAGSKRLELAAAVFLVLAFLTSAVAFEAGRAT